MTDYLLGAVSEAAGVYLIRRNRRARRRSIALWGVALIAAGVTSQIGGTYHGFRQAFDPAVAALVWKGTTIGMGIASFLLLWSALTASFSGRPRQWLVAAASLKLGIYVAWMAGHDDFVYVICDYGATLGILLLLVLAGRLHGEAGHRPYIVGGIFVSVAAAALQQSGVRFHRHFNHNDLMHVVQIGGVWLLYKGGARLRDAGGHHAG